MYDTKREEIKDAILKRIEDNETFTFQSLHSGLGDAAYRIADRTIQNLRKQGKIEYKKDGRQYVWYKVKG